MKHSLSDKELVIQILKNILWSINLILKRSENIKTYEGFLADDNGLEKLDSICMQFINIGEAVKKIDKLTNNTLLQNYDEIDWKAVKGMRDIITHNYFDIDAEIVFITINEQLPNLKKVLNKILTDINSEN